MTARTTSAARTMKARPETRMHDLPRCDRRDSRPYPSRGSPRRKGFEPGWEDGQRMRVRPYLLLLRRNRSFTRLYLAQLISFGGDWFATVALLGLALELTGSAALASLVLVLQSAPFFLASPFAGVPADRLDRRHLMVGADLLR